MPKPHHLFPLLFLVCLVACQPAKGPLEGAWELVSQKLTSADTTLELDLTQKKILTARHFAFGRQQPEGAYSGGGRYAYDGEQYTEIIEYHSNSELVDTTLVFDCRLEGDSLWYHAGDVGSGIYLEEVWRRIR